MDAGEIWDAMLQMRAKRGLGSLSDSEKTICCLYRQATGLETERLNVRPYNVPSTRSGSA